MYNRIITTFKIEKLSTKLECFQQLNFDGFLRELYQKSNIKLSLKEQDEWEEYFNEKKICVQDLEKEINQLDDKINEMVYNIYGLSNDEIMIIEKELKI